MSESQGRLLAIDLGEVRIGLALSDPLGAVAHPAGFLERRHGRRDVERIVTLAREHGVVRVVVGYPLLLSGQAGTSARDAEAFASELRAAFGGPVDLWDERLTTAEAQRAMIGANVRRRKRRAVVDSLAAVLILQNYIEARGAGA